MRLIDPGAGELSDRLTILALKVLFGAEAGKDVAHFKREQASILAKIRTRDLNGVWFEAYTALAAVNAALWQAEDELRALRNEPEATRAAWAGFGKTWVQRVADCAVRIQALNDRRSECISVINKETGDADGPEKVFAQ